jgi:hypothetical protein
MARSLAHVPNEKVLCNILMGVGLQTRAIAKGLPSSQPLKMGLQVLDGNSETVSQHSKMKFICSIDRSTNSCSN